jgi:hypothetical protein
MLNVILPCAGEGTRLGLPYPKELHHVASGVSLIDLSLQRLYPYRHLVGRITITLTARKADLVRCVAKWRSVFPFAFTYFDERNEEWPGSILSAEPLFMDRNVVLLPDSLVIETAQHPLAPSFDHLLQDHDLVFGVMREESQRLRSLGALRLEADGRVTAFCDKPVDHLERFNGFWGTFGFTGDTGRRILEVMTASVQRHPVSFETLHLRGPVGFPLLGYHDLGVWEQLKSVVNAGLIPLNPPIG